MHGRESHPPMQRHRLPTVEKLVARYNSHPRLQARYSSRFLLARSLTLRAFIPLWLPFFIYPSYVYPFLVPPLALLFYFSPSSVPSLVFFLTRHGSQTLVPLRLLSRALL